MKRFVVLGTAAALLAIGSTAQAMALENKWELLLSGIGSSDTSFDAGGFSFAAQVGYYLTDQLQVNFRQSAGYSDFGESTWSGGTRLGVAYNFNFDEDQMFVPFVGLTLGYLYGDATADTWAAGPEAGAKFFVNDTTFIFGSIQYEFLFSDTDDLEGSIDDGQFVYGLGIGVTF